MSAMTHFDIRSSSRPNWLTSEHPLPWLLPASALMIVFGVYPLIAAVLKTLYRKNAATRREIFDPLYNWTKIFQDPRMWDALWHTLLYTLIALTFQLVLGMLIALLLDSDRKGYGIFTRHDDPASGYSASCHWHDVPLDAEWIIRGYCAFDYCYGSFACRILYSRKLNDSAGGRYAC